MRLAAPLVGLAMMLAGCAELRERPTAPPPELSAGGEPLRAEAEALVLAFADGGRALTGRPAEMALAVARLEYMTEALASDLRLASVPERVRFLMVSARRESRGALGMAEGAPPGRAVDVLLATRRALLARDEPSARAAMAPIVRPGGLPPLGRLADMGGLPQAAIATAILRDEIVRLDLERGWRAGPLPSESPFGGISTVGLGGNTDR